MTTSNFQPGQIVKYSKPRNKAEKKSRFIVLYVTPKDGTIPEKLDVRCIDGDMNLAAISSFFSTEFVSA